jgi:hypothetical protein
MNARCNFVVGVYMALLLLLPTYFKRKTAATTTVCSKRTRRPWVCPIHVYNLTLGYDNLVPCTPLVKAFPELDTTKIFIP